MKMWMLSIAAAGVLATGACQKKAEGGAANEATAIGVENEATTDVAAASPPAAAPFDVAKVPVSTVTLGAFPYLSLPAGYVPSSVKTLDVARYPVWVGDHFEWVEGKVYDAGIRNAPDKDYSKFELQKNIEALVKQAGGVKITESFPPEEARKTIEGSRQAFDDTIGNVGSDPVQTYLIHQKDRDVWIQFLSNDSYGGWAIVEAEPFVPTATLIPAAPAQ